MQMVFLGVGAGKDPELMMINFHIVVVRGELFVVVRSKGCARVGLPQRDNVSLLGGELGISK